MNDILIPEEIKNTEQSIEANSPESMMISLGYEIIETDKSNFENFTTNTKPFFRYDEEIEYVDDYELNADSIEYKSVYLLRGGDGLSYYGIIQTNDGVLILETEESEIFGNPVFPGAFLKSNSLRVKSFLINNGQNMYFDLMNLKATHDYPLVVHFIPTNIGSHLILNDKKVLELVIGPYKKIGEVI
ncbi:MAG: hypothetical protein Q9M91_01485 [Candidatus Dojkabacteria bacterium]|nr:hypothetical protein [Candidatus Dojkabacteria bacterium]MDQ7020497.1 hypothetical protein [Candidatus Dojkabacteria bacterium]